MAPNTSARPRLWRWKRQGAWSKRVCRPSLRSQPARRSDFRSMPSGFPFSTGSLGARSRQSPIRGGTMADVALKAISKRFGEKQAVIDLDLSIADGEFVVLLGPTGAGKTTTLRLIAGLERPDAGTIRIAGRDATNLEPAARDVAFVFQQYSLYPHLTVYENLAFPLRSPARRIAEDQIRRRVDDVAQLVRIDHKLGSRST